MEKRIGDFLLIRLQVVEGDPDRMFRHDCKPDDPVYAFEDRTYPRERSSCGAAGDGQVERLLRRSERPGKYEDQNETGQEAEDCFPVHQVTLEKESKNPSLSDSLSLFVFFLKRKKGKCPVEFSLFSDGGQPLEHLTGCGRSSIRS
jgi:hypothetical protein